MSCDVIRRPFAILLRNIRRRNNTNNNIARLFSTTTTRTPSKFNTLHRQAVAPSSSSHVSSLYLSHRFMHPASSAPPGSKQNDNPAMSHTGSMGQNKPSNENQPDYGSPNNEKNLKNVPSGYGMTTNTPHPDPKANNLSNANINPSGNKKHNENVVSGGARVISNEKGSQETIGASRGFGNFIIIAVIGVGAFLYYTTQYKSKGHEYTGTMTEIKEKGEKVMKEDNVKPKH